MKIRIVAAVIVGRVVRLVARLRGGGSAIPGLVALRIAPDFLQQTLSKIPLGVVLVSGSNGKSTTTSMLAAMIRAHNLKVFTNPSGGNLPQGIASAVLADVSFSGRLRSDIAVLEVDEAYGVSLSCILTPRTVLLMNVQIDQLNRFYDPERVVHMLEKIADSASVSVILNRDDNYLVDLDATLSGSQRVRFFGASPELISQSMHGTASAQRFDRRADLLPTRSAEVTVTELNRHAALLSFADGSSLTAKLPSRGLHYALDAAGATATAYDVLGENFRAEYVVDALEKLDPVYGRGEIVRIGQEDVEIMTMKNPASLQLNLDALQQPPEQLLMAMDEGTPDPSWLYDIDFRSLSHVDVMTGSKAWQLALRCGYADIPVTTVTTEVHRAVKIFLELPPPRTGHKTMIVNYEQMMLIRKILGFTDLEKGA